jgi:hypothetical protein
MYRICEMKNMIKKKNEPKNEYVFKHIKKFFIKGFLYSVVGSVVSFYTRDYEILKFGVGCSSFFMFGIFLNRFGFFPKRKEKKTKEL